jgi:hypothetical protein
MGERAVRGWLLGESVHVPSTSPSTSTTISIYPIQHDLQYYRYR